MEGIQYVTSVVTLVAFIFALVSGALRARLRAREKAIRAAPPQDRLEMARVLAGEFQIEADAVDTETLSPEQKFMLLMEQVRQRERALLARLATLVVVVLIGAAATIALYYMEGNRRGTGAATASPAPSPDVVDEHGASPSPDPEHAPEMPVERGLKVPSITRPGSTVAIQTNTELLFTADPAILMKLTPEERERWFGLRERVRGFMAPPAADHGNPPRSFTRDEEASLESLARKYRVAAASAPSSYQAAPPQ
jgi:hypothetical protein